MRKRRQKIQNNRMLNKLKKTFSPLLIRENLTVLSEFINGNIIDIHKPTTSLNNLHTSLEGIILKIPDVQCEKMMQSLLGLIADKEVLGTMQQEYRKVINDLEKQIKDNKEASSLLDLIWCADKKIPFSPLIVFQYFLPEMEFYRRAMEPLDLFSQAGKSTDEAKARALIRALRETAEMLYEPYLRALFQIAMFAEGKWSKGPENFGSLVKQTHEKLKSHPEIVEPNAGWLRNAASHAHWVYEVNKKTIIVWDRTVKPKRMTIQQLEKVSSTMYQMVCNKFWMVRGFYTMCALDELKLFEILQEYANITNKDTSASEVVNKKLEDIFMEKFQPLVEFLKSQKG